MKTVLLSGLRTMVGHSYGASILCPPPTTSTSHPPGGKKPRASPKFLTLGNLAFGKLSCILAAVVTLGCTPSHFVVPRATLASYLDRANGHILKCRALLDVRDTEERSAPEVGPRSKRPSCGVAPNDMQPLFADAARSLRYERGTKMYLNIHYGKWNSIMRNLETDSSEDMRMVDREIETLRELERKIR